MFILLMFFLFKYVDEFIGKGFEWYTILEIMMYQSAVNVAMALPLAILLSSIMTFGTLGENYELVAIKSAGISLQKAMRPLFVLVISLSVASFFFSDYMLPKANSKYYSLLYDMRNKKLSFLIKPGVFNTSITNYAIKVDRKGLVNPDSLFGIMIYDHTKVNDPRGVPTILLAKKGRMIKTEDGSTMILKLIDGIRYEESRGNGSTAYNPRQAYTRMRFQETEVKLDFSSFTSFNRTDEEKFQDNAPMLNLRGLTKRADSLSKTIDSLNKATKVNAGSYYKQNHYVKGYTKTKAAIKRIRENIIDVIPPKDRYSTIQNAIDLTSSLQQVVNNRIMEYDLKQKEVLKSKIEYQRKFTLAVSCLLLFFIGAPLGAIIRKGGLGLPVVIAVVFFLIYHIISTVAEKSAKEGSLDHVFGMWMAVIVLTPLGIFLTYKATVDSAIFDIDYYKQILVNLFKKVFRQKTQGTA
ncbi:lipopolysaccharide export system permease protein [Pedobacter insulae]|uniref:Lipopolysaccharide export system permease protein n=2 Tax=Pedobacter insulae TaxID=414048 RepID=A0A1I2ZKT4_9SPHI|nr:lipopolysaccharide export system permease protein [Pedobacter insulae]